MTDISRNWLDLSVNSNILKQTYINGFIDVCNNIVGRENMWINNEKDVGNTRFGLGTLDPSATIHIMSDDPTIRMTNRTITQSTTNNQNLGRIDFEDKAHIRSENVGNDADDTGSLFFSTGNTNRFVIGSTGKVGIGQTEPTSTDDELQIQDGIIFLGKYASDQFTGSRPPDMDKFIHCDGNLYLSSPTDINIISDVDTTNPSLPIVMGGGSDIDTNTIKDFDYSDAFPMRQEVMRVNGNGNVGIGTTNPAYNLDVNGDVRINGPLYTGVNNHYAGAGTSSGFYNYQAALDNHGWKSNLSITLPSKGVWLINAYWDIRSANDAWYRIYSFGIGLGTDSEGTNLARHNYHKGGNGLISTVENRSSKSGYLTDRKAGRNHISTCYVNTSSTKTIYMGHILTSNATQSRPSSTRLSCTAYMWAYKLNEIY
jgi:hypothetical protein